MDVKINDENAKVLGKKKKEKKVKKIKAKNPLELFTKVFGEEVDDIDREPLPTETANKPVLFTNAVHIFYGVSGVGKSYTVAKLVGETDRKYKMYLDGEHNGKDLRLYCKKHGVEYIPADIAVERFKLLLESKMDLSDVIVVADSFHNMLPENKSQNQSDDTSHIYKHLHNLCVKKNLSIVVVEHATSSDKTDQGTQLAATAKLEGNETGKLKNADFAYRVSEEVDGDYKAGVWLYCTKSRNREEINKFESINVKFEAKSTFKSEPPKTEKPTKKKSVKKVIVTHKPTGEEKKLLDKVAKMLPAKISEIVSNIEGKNLDQMVMKYVSYLDAKTVIIDNEVHIKHKKDVGVV